MVPKHCQDLDAVIWVGLKLNSVFLRTDGKRDTQANSMQTTEFQAVVGKKWKSQNLANSYNFSPTNDAFNLLLKTSTNFLKTTSVPGP